MKKLLIVALLLVVSACASTASEPSILSGQLCGKLCWNNIVVGTTNKQELLKIISTLPNVNQDSITIFDEPYNIFDGRVFFSLYKEPSDKNPLVNISVYTIDQKVAVISFSGKLGIKFQDVVDAFGEPEFVFTAWPRENGVGIGFINSSRGIVFSYLATSEKSNISPETEIMTLELFNTNLYQKLLETNWLIPGYDEFILYPWNDYGEIEERYWPPR